MPSKRTQVLIAGGGIGGLTCAHRLRRKLPESTSITVVEPREQFQFAPDLLWVFAGTRRPEQAARPMRKMIPKGVELVTGSVTGLDPDGHRIETSTGELTYDKLVVALGSPTVPGDLAGFSQGAHDLYSVEGALSGRDAVQAIRGGRVVVAITRLPFRCPAAPYEAAFIADSALTKRGVRDEVAIEVVTPEPLPMPTAGAALGHRVAAMLADRNISYRPLTSIEKIDPEAKTLGIGDGSTLAYDVLLAVPPHAAPAVLAKSTLAGANGYAPVDPGTLAASQPDVYVIGDAAAVPLPGNKVLPKAGVFAHVHANIVADRITDELAGRVASRTFDGDGSCFLELGGKRAGRASGTFTSSPPKIHMNVPGWWWHVAKVGVEQYWLHPKLWR